MNSPKFHISLQKEEYLVEFYLNVIITKYSAGVEERPRNPSEAIDNFHIQKNKIVKPQIFLKTYACIIWAQYVNYAS